MVTPGVMFNSESVVCAPLRGDHIKKILNIHAEKSLSLDMLTVT
jgi:hypothetical protein